MQLIEINVTDLREYARNTRTHSEEQVRLLADAIKEYGFTNPVLIDENNELIAGHGRTAAARLLGLEKVPAIRLDNLTETQKKALRIADNQLALTAGWDIDALREELDALDVEGFDLSLTGFNLDDIEALLDGATAPESMTRPPASPAPQARQQGGEEEQPQPQGGTAPSNFVYQEHYAVLVVCDSESHQARVYDELKGQGYECKVLVN